MLLLFGIQNHLGRILTINLELDKKKCVKNSYMLYLLIVRKRSPSIGNTSLLEQSYPLNPSTFD